MSPENTPSPLLFMETINAYEKTHALRAAIELDLFAAVAETDGTAAAVAGRTQAAERGVRILCDALTVMGLLTKSEGRYGLTPDSAVFLDSRSPAYLGGTVEFLLSRQIVGGFERLTEAVRRGGTALPDDGTTGHENPVWVAFARAMAPLMRGAAEEIAGILVTDPDRPLRVLDVAAGHGLFGIAVARAARRAEVTGLDWAPVLAVARENAAVAGVADRYRALEGSAFEVEPGPGWDVVLLTNFLHHFDVPTCTAFLRRVRSWLTPGGVVATLEFIPNEDRVSPPLAAFFSLVMLASTPAGDAYTFAELDRMFRDAGFSGSECRPLEKSIGELMLSKA